MKKRYECGDVLSSGFKRPKQPERGSALLEAIAAKLQKYDIGWFYLPAMSILFGEMDQRRPTRPYGLMELPCKVVNTTRLQRRQEQLNVSHVTCRRGSANQPLRRKVSSRKKKIAR